LPDKSPKKAVSQTVFEFSAGGVVVREHEVLLVWTKDLKGRGVVTLPKGLVGRHETSEAAALREVREETGYRCRVLTELPRSEYFYRRAERLVRKTVRWFLMEPVAQEGQHDHEITEVRWVPLAEALGLLSYESDRKLLEAVMGGEDS
jgi:8-oxo-dGTP pyrophosphatase MutT (NUDIX family)